MVRGRVVRGGGVREVWLERVLLERVCSFVWYWLGPDGSAPPGMR